MSTLKVDTILKRTGTGTITVGQSGDTVALPSATLTTALPVASGGTGGTSFSAAGLANTPAFMGYSSVSQTIAGDTDVHLIIGTEVWDTDNAFASSTFTVPSDKAGKYFFGGQCRISSMADTKNIQLMIFKNGSSLDRAKVKYLASTGNSMAVTVMLMEDCAVGDNFKLYVYQDNGSQTANSGHITFYGYRLLGV